MSKTAIILGATGLTGSILLQQLLNDDRYDTLKLFSRKRVDIAHPKIKEYGIDLLQLAMNATDFKGDDVFCCIGTTHAITPDKKKYHAIDYGIPVAAAQLCQQNSIKTLLIISSLGADATSRIFYNRTKGEMEEAVLSFQIPKTHILQPSLIGGKRTEKRTGEYFFKQVMKIIHPFLIGGLRKYRTIPPEMIASAMVWLANNEFDKKRILSDELQALSRK